MDHVGHRCGRMLSHSRPLSVMSMASDVPATSASQFDCPACGAHGTWHPGRQGVVCPACDTAIDDACGARGPVDAFEFLPLLRDRPGSGRDWQPGATRVRCSACATLMEYPAYLAGKACEACGSPTLVPCDVTGAPVHPSGVLPFAIGAGDARERFSAWLDAKRTFGLRRKGFMVDTVRGVYLPCWMFSVRARVPWRGEYPKKNRNGEYEPHAIDGVVDKTFGDLLVPASGSTPNEELQKIEPFPVDDLRAYEAGFLAGYEVEVYGVNLWDAWDVADARMQREVDAALRRSANLAPSALETWPEWSEHRCRHVLVPVYSVDYVYRRVRYRALVNGRTGQTAGRLPKDALRMAAGILTVLGSLLVVLAILLALVAGLVGLLKAVF